MFLSVIRGQQLLCVFVYAKTGEDMKLVIVSNTLHFTRILVKVFHAVMSTDKSGREEIF
jgi:hypothetical protein